jgi:hypothetical protein
VNDGKASLRMRATRKVVMAAGGEVIDDLVRRIAELEAEVQENRKVNLRVAELVDVVAELLVRRGYREVPTSPLIVPAVTGIMVRKVEPDDTDG